MDQPFRRSGDCKQPDIHQQRLLTRLSGKLPAGLAQLAGPEGT